MEHKIPENGIIGPIKVSVPKDPYYLYLIRYNLNMVLSDLGACEKVKTALILSLDEACSNLIRHRAVLPGKGTINVTLFVEKKKICMDIHDFCIIEDIPKVRTPPRSKMTSGGLGIMIIKKCVDKMEFIKNDGKMADLRLTKLL